MQCKEIILQIEEKYPVKYAMHWDNVGLLAGKDDKEVKTIYLAVDATDEVVDEAVRLGVDMLITHHPLIFGGIKKINNQDFIGNRLLKLISNDISYYAMHTNYDVAGMADAAAKKLGFENAEVLEITECDESGDVQGIGKIAKLSKSVSLKEYCETVKKAFALETVKVFGNLEQKVQTVAIYPGSGKGAPDVALSRGADVLITGDIGHHTGIDAQARGISIIDAGHYGIEHIFTEDMKKYLEEKVAGVEIIEAPVSHPFVIV